MAQEVKPKEKTIFSVKIESIDPAAKAKIIREVKAQVANLNLMEVRPVTYIFEKEGKADDES